MHRSQLLIDNMMNRCITIAGRNLPRAVTILANSPPQVLWTSDPSAARRGLNTVTRVEKCSTKAADLKMALPEFWVVKMKTVFGWLDADGDGYLSEIDFVNWTKEMPKSFPDMSEEQKKIVESHISGLWHNLFGAKGKGADYKMTENMYIERCFWLLNQEGTEDKARRQWNDTFTGIDVNNDGMISKAEHRRFFDAWKGYEDPIGATVGFMTLDENMDGMITRDEFVNAALEYHFNFADETKPSKLFFGPLVKM